MSTSVSFYRLGAALLALTVMSTSVMAQDGQRPDGQCGRFGNRGGFGFGGFGGGGFSGTGLLRVEKVQTELNLSEDQKTKIREIQEAARSSFDFGSLRDLSEEERRAKFTEMREKGEAAAKEASEKINGVLTTEQKNRLDQISLQLRGIRAVADPEYASKLGISDDQKQKITDIYEAQREMMGELFSRDQSREEREKNREKMDELRAETDKAVMDVLTADQRTKFEASQGAKFELDRSELFGSFRRPGGNGGPGGRPQRGNDNN